jgi:hypothetical protein
VTDCDGLAIVIEADLLDLGMGGRFESPYLQVDPLLVPGWGYCDLQGNDGF